jgi:hypothetical protein
MLVRFEAWHGLSSTRRIRAFVFGAIVAAPTRICAWTPRGRRATARLRGRGHDPLRWSPLVRRSVPDRRRLVAGVLAVASRLDPTWITSDRLEASRSVKRSEPRRRPRPCRGSRRRPRQRVPVLQAGSRAERPSRGAGDDWMCAFVNSTRLGQLSLTYRLPVNRTGATAEGPEASGRCVRDARGGSRRQPLFAFDGCMIARDSSRAASRVRRGAVAVAVRASGWRGRSRASALGHGFAGVSCARRQRRASPLAPDERVGRVLAAVGRLGRSAGQSAGRRVPRNRQQRARSVSTFSPASAWASATGSPSRGLSGTASGGAPLAANAWDGTTWHVLPLQAPPAALLKGVHGGPARDGVRGVGDGGAGRPQVTFAEAWAGRVGG